MNKAFIFPGQGSQSVGMLSELATHFPEIQKEIYQTASDAVGFDVWELSQNGPEETLNQTAYTQVSMLTADVFVFRVLQSLQLTDHCSVMAGHSLGEYAALVCSGAISLAEAAPLVYKRGQLMQQHIGPGIGGMAAIIGLSDDDVADICTNITSETSSVIPANYNAPGQVVIAGHLEAVEKAISRADEAGARMAKLIPVSVPCHCHLLKGMAEEFISYLKAVKWSKPSCPVISNVDLAEYDSTASIIERLAQQLYSPVRWVESVELIKNMGAELIIESGPGKVLSGLVKRIDRSIKSVAVNDMKSIEQLETMIETTA